MKQSNTRRRKIKVCYEKLGLVLLGSLTAVLVLSSYPSQTPDVTELQNQEKRFDIQENDVLVVLDIANTGMDTLSSYLITQAILNPPCQCENGLTRCTCLNKRGEHWLFQAFNTTGYFCGEHADFTTLLNCPIDYWFRSTGKDNRMYRKYLLVTMLRDPVTRFLSQWLSVTREDTFFKNEPRLYRNVSVELQKKEFACYLGKTLSNLSLEDFMNCRENGARNVQTRMLANMSYVNGLHLSGQNQFEAMLESAKRTVRMLPFFGLFERPNDTQKLLESTLGMKFKRPLIFEDPIPHIPATYQHQIVLINNLDVRLYQFAKEIFKERVNALRFPFLKSAIRNVDDNYKIVYRPELNAENEDHQSDEKGFDDEIKDEVIPDVEYGAVVDAAVNFREKSAENPKQDRYGAENTGKSEENADYENKEKFDEGPKISGKKMTKGVNLDVESSEYQLDVEDVDVFLNRLNTLKQQQKQPEQKQQQQQPQHYLFQQKIQHPLQQKPTITAEHSRQQQQQLQGTRNAASNSFLDSKMNKLLEYRQSKEKERALPKVTASFSAREIKPYANFVLTDPKKEMKTSKTGRNEHEKALDRMFL